MENIVNHLDNIVRVLFIENGIIIKDVNPDSPFEGKPVGSERDDLYYHVSEDEQKEEWFVEIAFDAPFDVITRHLTTLLGEPSHPKTKSHPDGEKCINNWELNDVLIVHGERDGNHALYMIEEYVKVPRRRG